MSKLPFDPSQLSLEDKLIYEAMVEKRKSQGAPFNGPYFALMNHPELCKRVEALGYYLKFQGHLAREVYQFVVLSVARETKASFEWTDHVSHARAAGVPESVIEEIQTRGALGGTFDAPYALAAKVLASTLVWKNIPQEVQNAAIDAYGLYGFIEIVTLSGFYQMFSAINEGFDIKPIQN